MNKSERINKAVVGCDGDDYHALMRASVTNALRKQAGFIPGKVAPIPDGLSNSQLIYHVSGGKKWYEIFIDIRIEIGFPITDRVDRFGLARLLFIFQRKNWGRRKK